MKIILTGSEGNLGTSISRFSEYEILNINRHNWEEFKNIKQSDYDLVIHCAYDLKTSFYQEPEKILDSNVLSTAKLLKICKLKKISKIVFVSSCSVYGTSSDTNENIDCKPITMNGYTKYFNECIIQNFCMKNNMDYLILRVFNSYGGNDHFSVISKMINCALNNAEFKLVNNGQSQRDYVHVDDVSKVILKMVKIGIINQIINIGSGKSISIKAILNRIEEKFGKLKIQHETDPGEIIYSRANINKLNQYLAYDFMDVIDFIDDY